MNDFTAYEYKQSIYFKNFLYKIFLGKTSTD